jgi:hypothetical protein
MFAEDSPRHVLLLPVASDVTHPKHQSLLVQQNHRGQVLVVVGSENTLPVKHSNNAHITGSSLGPPGGSSWN